MKKAILLILAFSVLFGSLVACGNDYNETSNYIMSDDLEFTLVKVHQPPTKVTFQLHNPTSVTYYFGHAYQFEVLNDGVWYTTDYGTKDIPAELLSIGPGETIEDTFYTHEGNKFRPNTYRVVMEFWKEADQGGFEKGIYICGQFTIK